ncbi:MAG: FAD-dependent oxidoreductase [Maricaulaceae bacterium]
MTKNMKRVVIAGFGDTGVLVAAHLKAGYDVTAISTRPALVSGQELGARLTNLPLWKEKYLVGFDRLKNLDDVRIIHGKATSINAVENSITVRAIDGVDEALSYDALVIASGTTNGFWRNADVKTDVEIVADLQTRSETLAAAKTLAIIGGGPSAISAATNAKEQDASKDVHLFFRQPHVLAGYPEKTRAYVSRELEAQDITLHAGHHADIPKDAPASLRGGTVNFISGQEAFDADCILWAAGQVTPNNDFIPDDMLTENGFVKVESTLRVSGHDNIFAVGDIAATDPNRSSARNAGFQTLAVNLDRFLSGRGGKMKTFKAPKYRWGSILGIRKEGLRIFTPKGGNIKVGPRMVDRVLFPVFVHRMIYRGIRKD